MQCLEEVLLSHGLLLHPSAARSEHAMLPEEHLKERSAPWERSTGRRAAEAPPLQQSHKTKRILLFLEVFFFALFLCSYVHQLACVAASRALHTVLTNKVLIVV